MLAVVAVLVGFELARPLGSASVAFDSQVAVLHFERLLDGRQLEAFLPTTPKPFLTIVFGALFEMTGDWRALVWATLLAYGAGVGLAAILARRVGGSVAAVFAGVAVLVAPTILFDVGFALATPWAMLGWLFAGLAVTSGRPHYGLAGIALALATLARLETLVLTGTIVAVLIVATAAPRSLRRWERPAARAWLVPAIGLAALPVMMVHDLLLTGDPLLWTTVAGIYTERTVLHVPSTTEVIGLIVSRYWSIGALTLSAVVGAVALVRARSWPVLVGLLGLGPGVAAFLIVLAIRGIFVSERYLAAVDVSVAFAAGLGAAALVHWLAPADGWSGLAGRREGGIVAQGGALVVVGLVALVLAGPYWEVDPELRPSVNRSRRLAADTDRAVAILRPELASIPGATDPIGPDDPPPDPIVTGPGPVHPRLVVDLGVAIPIVASNQASELDVAGGYPAPGQLVFHSTAGDAPADGWADLEVSAPTVVGATRIVPLLADEPRGLWVLRLEDAGP